MTASSSLVLDLDGTLLDARLRQVGVAAEAVRELTGRHLEEDAFWTAKREGATTFSALSELGFAAADARAVAERWAARVESEEWLARDRALPGVASVLGDLRNRFAAVVVLTARRRVEGARASLAAAGLADLVDEVTVVDPSVSVEAKAEVLGRRRPAAFVGDTESDGEAAVRAQTWFTAVATGQRSASYLAARGYHVAGTLRAALATTPARSAARSLKSRQVISREGD